MSELFRVIEPPRDCGYLPAETAALEVRAVARMTPEEYGELLSRGYRRFGWQVFRPACPQCSACRSMRVLAKQFTPNASERRVLRLNEEIRAELHPQYVTREIVNLYNRYHRFMHEHRGWPEQQNTIATYSEGFLSGSSEHGRQWLYFEKERLMGVALMDEAPNAISLVYCFYDPDWRPRSPGTFSVLTQLQYARTTNREYAYLGYWVKACQSLNYKHRFRPHELLRSYPADDELPIWE